jgi:UDP-GlcNAc:undecaprenyl-phosphate GlcNAc-1-phosphate transferase
VIPTLPIVGFVISAALAFSLVAIARSVAVKTGWISVAREDRFHSGDVPLLGGAAVVASMVAGFFLCRAVLPSTPDIGTISPATTALLIGFLGLFVLGMIDDRRGLSPLWKGLVQGIILAAVFVVWRPETPLGPIASGAICWLIGMVLLNAWNYLDHADGIFATAAAIGAAVLAVLCRGIIDPLGLQIVLWALAGAMIGFLAWNLPPARIFLGDAGALPLGFALVFASIVLFDSGSVGSLPGAMAPHALVATDFLLVTIARIASGRHPFVGGREHTGHRLTGAVGAWNTLAVVLVFVFATGFGTVLLAPRWPFILTIALPVLCLVAASSLLTLPVPRPRKAPSKPQKTRSTRG